MKSSATSAPIFPTPAVVCVHSGPTPTMNSTVSDKVNGFLNRRSMSHSVWPPPKRGAMPASISSQSLIGVNSMAADGPKLVPPLRKPHSPAPAISTIAAGSFSSAHVLLATNTRAASKPIIAPYLTIRSPPLPGHFQHLHPATASLSPDEAEMLACTL